jgi:hypothetical protein
MSSRGAPATRREALRTLATGFGAAAFAALFGARAARGVLQEPAAAARLGDGGAPFPRRLAKRAIFLYMDGGVSQVDSFDPKPRLTAEDGQPIGMAVPKTQFADVGTVLRSPWEFRQHGESGLWVSDLFPHVARHADRLAIVRSMTSKFSEHTGANYFLHTGNGQQGRPSMGAWISYGLGSESADLPGFIVLNGGLIPAGGLDNFGSGFLPARFQGSVFQPGAQPIANLRRREGARAQRAKLDLVRELDRAALDHHGGSDAVEAAIANAETAFRMQVAVPEAVELSRESAETRRAYGLESEYEPTRTFGTQCLLARRLVERGVRFVELTPPDTGNDRWDQHSNLEKGHADNARAVDQPIGALLEDLAQRGMLDDTLVIFGTEFGRTPMAQGRAGRDHNPFGFSVWLAGAGVRGGIAHGATDDYGYYAVEDPYEIHDLHATMLHLMGVHHREQVYRFDSRDMRLTDVHGKVIRAVVDA